MRRKLGARAEEEARFKAEEEARIKAEQDAQVKAEQEVRLRAEHETRARVAQEALAKAEEEARVRAEQEAWLRAEEQALAKAEQLSKEQFQSATAAATFPTPNFGGIADATMDYSKTSLNNRLVFVEKLLGARSFQSAIHIRSEYTRTSYADFIAYLTKIGELNAKFGEEAFKRRSHVS